MEQKPKILIVLAVFHFFAPVGNLLINGFLLGRPVEHLLNLFSLNYLSMNWPIVVAPIVAGFAIYLCKKWSFFVFMGSTLFLLLFSVIGYLSKADLIGIVPLIFVFVINVLVVGYFLVPAVRDVYFDPQLRWWERSARFLLDQDCSFLIDGQSFEGVVTNISQSGLFVSSTDLPHHPCDIEVHFKFEANEIRLKGSVVYSKPGLGAGVRFDEGSDWTSLKLLIQSLKSQDRKIPVGMGAEESFFLWLKNLIQSGKGILPLKANKKTSV